MSEFQLRKFNGQSVTGFFSLPSDAGERLFALSIWDVFCAMPEECTEKGFWLNGCWFASWFEMEAAKLPYEDQGPFGPANRSVLQIQRHLLDHGTDLGMLEQH